MKDYKVVSGVKPRGAVPKQVFSWVQASPRSHFHAHARRLRECQRRRAEGFKHCTTPVFIPEPTCHLKHDQRFFNSERLDRVKVAPPRCHLCRSARSNNFWHTWTCLGTPFSSRRAAAYDGKFQVFCAEARHRVCHSLTCTHLYSYLCKTACQSL